MDHETMPDDWQQALVLMAHPDDPEYGVGAVVAEWTAAGKDVEYVLVSRGEAGIAGMPPAESAKIRAEEQARACGHVGVSALRFLDYPDGRITAGIELRRDLAREIRRAAPQLVIISNHHETWGPGRWNSADHRAVGRSVLDAVADAANAWIFEDLADEGFAPWAGVRWVASASPRASHMMAVSDESIRRAVDSLAEHRRYLEALNDEPVREQAQRQLEIATGGVAAAVRAVGFELYSF